MMLWLLWALACHAKADDYTYDVSDPVYTKLADKLHRLKREHKPLRLKVNSHTGAGKTYFIRHHDANYRGCRLLDFDDFEGANRSSALSWRTTRARCCWGRLIWTSTRQYDRLRRASLKDIRRNVAKRNAGRRQTPRAVVERHVHPQKRATGVGPGAAVRSFLRSKGALLRGGRCVPSVL